MTLRIVGHIVYIMRLIERNQNQLESWVFSRFVRQGREFLATRMIDDELPDKLLLYKIREENHGLYLQERERMISKRNFLYYHQVYWRKMENKRKQKINEKKWKNCLDAWGFCLGNILVYFWWAFLSSKAEKEN